MLSYKYCKSSKVVFQFIYLFSTTDVYPSVYLRKAILSPVREKKPPSISHVPFWILLLVLHWSSSGFSSSISNMRDENSTQYFGLIFYCVLTWNMSSFFFKDSCVKLPGIYPCIKKMYFFFSSCCYPKNPGQYPRSYKGWICTARYLKYSDTRRQGECQTQLTTHFTTHFHKKI